ncbi:bile acid:sodium symporter family protein [Picosynechococcus sp. PCC 7117]|uniref:bile acid:sodium symporter family protein n=1 Tax=Picosynechococcus sp. PCC 7117 TaxID=195498 RepID=UPI000810E321|nr:bile acid:sodium symporter family protein [Picosynechococcus sp. PCC 7117]ANV87016.1 bile acid:sodium symporter [Picosynechococcus sp. PCC 7117]
MNANFLTAVLLPLALFVIMLGMGLGLTPTDFKRVLVEPRGVIVGAIAQLLLLPLVGFGLANLFPLTPELAVGVMVLAACPGGSTSNLITYLVRGNVALSITLTAVSSLITVFTIPLVINGAMQYFLGASATLQLPFLKTVIQIAVITLIPIGIGMTLHRYAPKFAATVEGYVKWLSLFFLGLVIAGLLLAERANVVSFFLQVGWVMLALNVIMMFLGYAIALGTKLDGPSAKSISVEVGIQNGTLAIAIASTPTLLNAPTMAIPAAIYSLLMFITSAAFGWFIHSQTRSPRPTEKDSRP